MSQERRPSDTRIYIGNLPPDIRTKDLEDIFYKYGKIKFIDLKNRKGPPFAFIEFEDARDAEDAVKGRDCYMFEGYKLRVEFQKSSRGGGGGSGAGYGGGSQRTMSGRNAPPRRSDYRVVVSGLPPTGSWQDLKDHMREAGTVCFADVFRDGTGVVEFVHYDDMKYAIKNLDDTKFRSHEGDTSFIRVKAANETRSSRLNSVSRSRSHSSTRRRERASPTYSPAKKSRSRSRSYDSNEENGGSRKKRKTKHHRRRSTSRSLSRSRTRSRSKSRSRSYSRHRSSRTRSRTRSRSRSPRFTNRGAASRSPSKSPRRSSSSPNNKNNENLMNDQNRDE